MIRIVTTTKVKKICKILTIVWTSLICASIFPLGIWMFLYAPDLNSVQYYSDSANYVSFDGSVQSFFIGENYIEIKLNHSQKEFYDNFKINGKNFALAVKNGLLDILQKDTLFTITSASAYLGDDWAYPVIALTYEGNEIIPYEEGMQNNVEVQQNAENYAKSFIIVLGSVVGALSVLDVCSIIVFLRRKENKL